MAVNIFWSQTVSRIYCQSLSSSPCHSLAATTPGEGGSCPAGPGCQGEGQTAPGTPHPQPGAAATALCSTALLQTGVAATALCSTELMHTGSVTSLCSNALLCTQVLHYLTSPRGRLGKTYGCFSLLGGDQHRDREGGTGAREQVLD